MRCVAPFVWGWIDVGRGQRAQRMVSTPSADIDCPVTQLDAEPYSHGPKLSVERRRWWLPVILRCSTS